MINIPFPLLTPSHLHILIPPSSSQLFPHLLQYGCGLARESLLKRDSTTTTSHLTVLLSPLTEK